MTTRRRHALFIASLLAIAAPAALAERPPLVEVVQPERALVRDELVTFGSLRSDESTMIRPEVDGRVASLQFREGQAVKAGDLLVSLDDAIARTEEEIKLIREYRDRQIADVVTGQVDVRGWQPGPDDVVDDTALAALGDDSEDVTEGEDGDGED